MWDRATKGDIENDGDEDAFVVPCCGSVRRMAIAAFVLVMTVVMVTLAVGVSLGGQNIDA